MLNKKHVELPGSYDNQIILHAMARIFKVVERLCDDTSLIQKVEICLDSRDGIFAGKKKVKDIDNDSEQFDTTV